MSGIRALTRLRAWRPGIGALLALGCARAGSSPGSGAPAPARDGLVHLTILHINDVYEISPLEGGRSGGLARVATVLKRLKAQNSNTRMFLGGDFVSPSAIGTARVGGERLGGRQMVAVLNAAGLDVATLGNHEFDISTPDLVKRMGESRFGYVSSNVTDSAGGGPLPRLRHHLILPFPDGRGGTVRLGVVGATINQRPRPGVCCTPAIGAIRSEVALIRDSVDAIVALTHLALADDAMLADSVPELDLILGGHEHQNWAIRRGPRFTPIIKADANVRSVAIVDLAVGRRTDRRTGGQTDRGNGTGPAAGQASGSARVSVNWRIVTITDSIPEDRAVAAEAARWTALANEAFEREGLHPGRVVVTTPVALDARETIIRTQENDFTRLVTGAWLNEAPLAQVALFNSGSIRLDDVLPAGPLTEYDVIRLLPFGGNAVEVEMTGALLKRVLEQGQANRGSGGFLLVGGVERTATGWRLGPRGGTVNAAAADSARVGQQATLLMTTPLDTTRRYRVVTTDFLVSGGEQNLGYLSTANPGLRMLGTLRDVRFVLMDELKRRWGK